MLGAYDISSPNLLSLCSTFIHYSLTSEVIYSRFRPSLSSKYTVFFNIYTVFLKLQTITILTPTPALSIIIFVSQQNILPALSNSSPCCYNGYQYAFNQSYLYHQWFTRRRKTMKYTRINSSSSAIRQEKQPRQPGPEDCYTGSC